MLPALRHPHILSDENPAVNCFFHIFRNFFAFFLLPTSSVLSSLPPQYLVSSRGFSRCLPARSPSDRFRYTWPEHPPPVLQVPFRGVKRPNPCRSCSRWPTSHRREAPRPPAAAGRTGSGTPAPGRKSLPRKSAPRLQCRRSSQTGRGNPLPDPPDGFGSGLFPSGRPGQLWEPEEDEDDEDAELEPAPESEPEPEAEPPALLEASLITGISSS